MDRWVNRNQNAHWQKRRTYRPPDSAAAEAFAVPKLEWLCHHLDVGAQTSVLDVGAGNGMFTYWWTRRVDEVLGIELSSNMIERSPVREHLQQGDALDLPFEDSSFDVVFAGNLLHHLVQPERALLEMARVSRGGIAVCEGNRNHLPMAAFGMSSRTCRGLLNYSKRTLGELVQSSGIGVIDVTCQGYVYENHCPGFALPVSRSLERRMRGGAYLLLAGHTERSISHALHEGGGTTNSHAIPPDASGQPTV